MYEVGNHACPRSLTTSIVYVYYYGVKLVLYHSTQYAGTVLSTHLSYFLLVMYWYKHNCPVILILYLFMPLALINFHSYSQVMSTDKTPNYDHVIIL